MILSNDKLGRFPKQNFNIELKSGTGSYHGNKNYSVPWAVNPILKEELTNQCIKGILERHYESEWGLSSMAISNKYGSIHTVENFLELNKHVLRKRYPMTKIQDMFHLWKVYHFSTLIYITLCYYAYYLKEYPTWNCILSPLLASYDDFT